MTAIPGTPLPPQPWPVVKLPDGQWALCSSPSTAARLQRGWNSFDELLAVIEGLKRGSCWCEAAVDNPMMGGKHSRACKAARAAMARARELLP
ncbi:MAG TPA: hypothetical protein VM389_00205 [Phycisphaerae bacterium]|nr:hypothetical protein [Phycisphaerae bacterium]